MNSSRLKWIFIGGLVATILATSTLLSGLAIGYIVGNLGSNGGITQQLHQVLSNTPLELAPDYVSDPPEGSEDLLAPFWQAWDIVHQEYVDQPLNDEELMRGAIEGAIAAIGDPQTSYMDPDTYLQANIPLEGSYEGIGAWVDTEGEYLTIVSPMPGSPAEAAGLEPGDIVIAIDGEDVTELDPNLVVRRVLGPAGSLVVLTIQRDDQTLDFEIERGNIEVPSLHSEMMADDIGYIQLFSFSTSSAADLHAAIRSLQDEGASALILDLRGNGGGFLNSAIEVSSEFIADGTILTERFGDGKEQTYEANGRGIATEMPLVVLINAGSASASEIVAGAIQDYGRGWLVGETSYGKGSVQNWIELDNEEGAVRVTVARWYTPNDILIDHQG
ncbi:MAG: S41 family peptidase, partial [Anaerolineales bacterium]|nr:S41 family peptidase [Anaerolineales bacterium]